MNYKMDYYSKQIKELTDYTDEFHNNLYARVNSNNSNGSHDLSISDIYYKKHFESNKK